MSRGFDQDDRPSRLGGGHRGGNPSGSAPVDDHVELGIGGASGGTQAERHQQPQANPECESRRIGMPHGCSPVASGCVAISTGALRREFGGADAGIPASAPLDRLSQQRNQWGVAVVGRGTAVWRWGGPVASRGTLARHTMETGRLETKSRRPGIFRMGLERCAGESLAGTASRSQPTETRSRRPPV